MRVRDITVRGRHRHDMGDIDRLACSIAEVGLLHPIVVRPDGRLIAGQRRLAAVRSLGWEEVLVTVMDLEDIGALLAGAEENTVRKDFLPSEAVAIGRAIRPGIARLARERERAGSPVSGRTQGRTRDLVARAVGLGRESFQRAEEIVSLARSDPEFGDLIARMDESGITWAYREMQRRQVTAKNEAEPPVPPDGRFRVIVVDPPWDAPVDAPYPLMSMEEIYALPVPEKAHADCILWLWTIGSEVAAAKIRVLDAWGFKFRNILTWDKEQGRPGPWMRNHTEFCLIATQGRPAADLLDVPNIIRERAREHSRKPEAFYRMVEERCPGSRLDWFARQSRDGWTTFGAEATLFDQREP